MKNESYDQIIEDVDRLKINLNNKQVKTLELDMLKRIAIRLKSFDCRECEDSMSTLGEYVRYLDENRNSLDKRELKEYRKRIEGIKAHLQKEHGLVPEGYYMSIYMSLGMSIGLVFGMLVFDNLALGLPIGMSVGLAIGAGIDADYKKKGKTI